MGLAQVTRGTPHLECTLGCMLGPIQYSSECFTTHLPYQLVWGITKGHKTEKWHLIIDFPFPPGGSVNDGIELTLCSMSYTSVELLAEVAARLGRGDLLAKVDIEYAYCLVQSSPSY